MKITRDVITDLLPLYQSGEASADTVTLVELFFEQDPEFAALVRGQQPILPKIQTTLSKETEMTSLNHTKSLLRKRAYYLAFAIFFSLFAFAIRFDNTEVQWMWLDTPILGAIFLVVGAWFAFLYRRTAKNLTGSNLE